jgi:hypothetical protein
MLALAGIVLTAVNLRIAITSLTVLYSRIAPDVAGFNQSLVAILPLICFAVFGFLAPRLSRRIGLERSLAAAMLLVVAGEVLRAFSSDIITFAITTILAGAGMAFGNVFTPPAIKRYFPNAIGPMTATYSIILAVSAAVPSLVAIPIANASGWRFSVSWWAVLALAAAIPWLSLHNTRQTSSAAAPGRSSAPAAPHIAVWKWPVAWGLVFPLGFGFLSMYSVVNYLSDYLAPATGHRYFTAATVGDMLFAYNLANAGSHREVPCTGPPRRRALACTRRPRGARRPGAYAGPSAGQAAPSPSSTRWNWRTAAFAFSAASLLLPPVTVATRVRPRRPRVRPFDGLEPCPTREVAVWFSAVFARQVDYEDLPSYMGGGCRTPAISTLPGPSMTASCSGSVPLRKRRQSHRIM